MNIVFGGNCQRLEHFEAVRDALFLLQKLYFHDTTSVLGALFDSSISYHSIVKMD